MAPGGKRAPRPRRGEEGVVGLRRRALGNDGVSTGGATPHPTADGVEGGQRGEEQKMSGSERHYVRLS